MDADMLARGYDKISGAGHSLNTNGIDGVYKWNPRRAPAGHTPPPPPPEYIIGEAKYGTSRLGDTVHSGGQMSDVWINSPVRPGGGSTRLQDAVGVTEAANINTAATTAAPPGPPGSPPPPPNVQKEVFKVKNRTTAGKVSKSGSYARSRNITF
jgi:hypothetical protein